jgi:hypothetical protein
VTGFIEAQRREGAKVSRKVELIESTENQNPDHSILQEAQRALRRGVPLKVER